MTTQPPARKEDKPSDHRVLRGLLWFYLALWLFEGALRKWILPGFANPLLVVRDPVLLIIYAIAYFQGVFPRSAFVGWIAGLGAVAFFTSFATTDTPVVVELYGLRAGYLHLPLVFVIAALFDAGDIQRVGKWTLLMGLPMAALVLLQFRARDSSPLNVGAGGGGGGMIESAFGHIRPSGTFSFTNGLSGFTALIAGFFLYHLIEKKVYPRWLWLATGPVLIVLIALSGSRLAVGTVVLLMATVLLISVVQPRYASSCFKLLVLGAAGALVLGSFAIFKEGMNVFAYRFGNVGNVQTGFVNRFFSSFLLPFETVKDATLFGRGLGMGTNVAAGLISGKRGFLVAEGEPARVILESGPIVGFAYLLLRVALTVYLGWNAFRSLRRERRTLPMLLFAGCFNDVLQGQFSQPTELGYATIAAGLCLASNNPESTPSTDVEAEPALAKPALPGRLGAAGVRPAPAPAPEPEPIPAPPAPLRGRSSFAERLHDNDKAERMKDEGRGGKDEGRGGKDEG